MALRAPDGSETAQALIEAAGVPLAAPSANRSGRVSPTTAVHVVADLDGRVDWILDGGPCRYGVESTIVAIVGGRPRLLRPGALTRERIEAVLGVALEATPGSATAPNAPGQLASHYAPRAGFGSVRADLAHDEAALDFGGALGERGGRRGSTSRRPATSRGRRRISSPICARSTPAARRGSRSRLSPPMGLGTRSTTGCAEPRRRAQGDVAAHELMTARAGDSFLPVQVVEHTRAIRFAPHGAGGEGPAAA